MLRGGLAALLLAGTAVAGAAQDLHAYWDGRCKSCHGDAGDFARRTLRVEAGRLVGRHHRDDLALFLRQHYLADALVEPVSDMLKAQATTPPLFQQHCAVCHGSAAAFARRSLTLRGDVLVGRSGGQSVAQLLGSGHGKLTPQETTTVVGTLERLMKETDSR